MVSLHGNHNSLAYHVLFTSFLLSVLFVGPVAEALGTFGYDIHHRYSDTVKKILGSDGLPEKNTVEYFAALVHRDHLRGRSLAGADQLTFVTGNLTGKFPDLGLLQYVYVRVGTPGLDFLVALDTGSDLFWVPCECKNCPRSITLRSGKRLDFNIYAFNRTSTMTPVLCHTPTCGLQFGCVKEENICSYQTEYIISNTSSTGLVLQDVLQLAANERPHTSVNTSITFGCGVVQTGAFLSTTAVNGVLGLGMGDVSVPSILASNGLTANSFSLCSGLDGFGRIVFGDEGSLDQSETSFVFPVSQPNYIVSIEQVDIGSEVSDLAFTAFFDYGLAFTRLSDPVYTTLSESFDSQVLDPSITISNLPFDYCYELSSTSAGPATPKSPNLAFTMNGGSQFYVNSSIVLVILQNSEYAYCLGVIKSQSVNIIGLNFMSGQKMIFNREKSVLGWKTSDCYGNDESGSGSNNTPPPFRAPPPGRPSNPSNPPPSPRSSNPPPSPRPSNPPPPPDSNTTPTEESPPPPPSQVPGVRLPGTGDAAQLRSFTYKVLMAFLSFFIHYFIFQY